MISCWHVTHGVDSFKVFKISVKDQNKLLRVKSGLRASKNVSATLSSDS